MKYLLLIYSNPKSREIWDGLSDAERAEGLGAHIALREDLAASGALIASAALTEPAQARRVTVRAGRRISTDGPFAEVKEHLAGFYLVECDSIEQAVEYAARVPEAAHVEVEVRPVWELDDPAAATT